MNTFLLIVQGLIAMVLRFFGIIPKIPGKDDES